MMELPKRHATSLYGQPSLHRVINETAFQKKTAAGSHPKRVRSMKGGHGLALLVIRVIYLSLDWLSGQPEVE
jgi:hypothetical protein